MNTEKKKRVQYLCKYCGGSNVRSDADLMWNVRTQAWEIAGEYDNATCDDCGGETSLIEVELAGEEV